MTAAMADRIAAGVERDAEQEGQAGGSLALSLVPAQRARQSR
jgi:hypothetical protein